MFEVIVASVATSIATSVATAVLFFHIGQTVSYKSFAYDKYWRDNGRGMSIFSYLWNRMFGKEKVNG